MEFARKKDYVKLHYGKCRIQCIWGLPDIRDCLFQVPQPYRNCILNHRSSLLNCCLSLNPLQRLQTRCTTCTMATPVGRSSRWPTTHWWRSLLHCYVESSTTTIPTMRNLETLSGVVKMSWAPGEKIWAIAQFSHLGLEASNTSNCTASCLKMLMYVVYFSRNVLIFFAACHYLSKCACDLVSWRCCVV